MITLDLANEELMGFGIVKPPPEEIAQMNAESAKYQIILHSIPLEKCEVIAGSVKLNFLPTVTYLNILSKAVRFPAHVIIQSQKKL